MPRSFTETERAQIQARLLEHGRSFLATYGVRKTSVDDLTAAAGISKGAFYLFFPSKEELFFTIFEQYEADYQAELLGLLERTEGSARERLRAFFAHAFSLWRSSPLFRHFGREEFEHLTRKLPPERLAAGLNRDEHVVAALLERWRAQGIAADIAPDLLTGLMRALFFVSLHADDIGPRYPQTIELLIEMVADKIRIT
ncbi:MAG TPA: TetR/AcrR family transcriptional regulator [Roseiflexaceae bacterium]|nr:TetR/AcrR family transcriptional regulator [Roseiflexaceae bacterium]